MKKSIFILTVLLFSHFTTYSQNIILTYKKDSLSNTYSKKITFENANLMNIFLSDSIKKLHKAGFIDAEYYLKQDKNEYEVELIKKNKVESITINLNKNTNADLLNDKFPKTVAFNNIDSQLNIWLETLEKKGQGLAKLFLSDYNLQNDTLYTYLNYEPDITRKIDNIVIEGYDKFPAGIKKDMSRKFIGLALTQKTTEKITKYIEQLNFITLVKPTEILFEENKTSTYIYVEKSKNNKFDGYIGFGSNEKGKIQFNGYLDLNLNNILNKGEQTALNWKSDGNKQTNFDFKTEIPYILKTPVAINFNINLFKQDSTFQTTNLHYGLNYYKNYNTRFGIGYKSNTSTYMATNTAGNNYTSKFLTFAFLKDVFNTNETVFKEKAQAKILAGTGKRNSDISSNQQFIEFEAFYNFKVNNKNYIYIKNHTHYLKSNNYLINELYRSGGALSFRGVNENSLQGNLISIINTEYRYVLNSRLYVYSITDFAHLEDKLNQTNTNFYSYGLGTGIINNTFRVNLNYVKSLNFDEQFNFNKPIIHISIKTLF